MLNPALAASSFFCIAPPPRFDEYRKNIDKDAALAAALQPVF